MAKPQSKRIRELVLVALLLSILFILNAITRHAMVSYLGENIKILNKIVFWLFPPLISFLSGEAYLRLTAFNQKRFNKILYLLFPSSVTVVTHLIYRLGSWISYYFSTPRYVSDGTIVGILFLMALIYTATFLSSFLRILVLHLNFKLKKRGFGNEN